MRGIPITPSAAVLARWPGTLRPPPSTKGSSLMLARTRSMRRCGVCLTVFSSASNSALSASGSWNGLPGASSIETPPSGKQEPHRPVHQIEPAADPFAERAVLVAGRAHQRDVRIMDDEFAAAEFLRHRFARAEIDHVERADRADIGECSADRRAKAVGIGREHPADDHVGDFGRGEVDEARQQARSRARFSIDRPPMPVAWNTRQS